MKRGKGSLVGGWEWTEVGGGGDGARWGGREGEEGRKDSTVVANRKKMND